MAEDQVAKRLTFRSDEVLEAAAENTEDQKHGFVAEANLHLDPESCFSQARPSYSDSLAIDLEIQDIDGNAGEEAADAEVSPFSKSEVWCDEDHRVFGLPIFRGCTKPFKRLLLRTVREYEYVEHGQETWFDEETDQICILQKLPPDVLPPLRPSTIGHTMEPGEYVYRGGEFDCRLVIVLEGYLEKLIGDTTTTGRIVVRRLEKGDCEGITEFLGVGSQQRTAAVRAGPEGAKVRYVSRDAVQNLINQKLYLDGTPVNEAEEDPDDPPPKLPKWPAEVSWFKMLCLERIDSLHHKASMELLRWQILDEEKPLDLLSLPGQNLFVLGSALGTSMCGPLPEGLEERYYFQGQTVLHRGIPGDCAIMILRGEVEAIIPDGSERNCLNRDCFAVEGSESQNWLGNGRERRAMNSGGGAGLHSAFHMKMMARQKVEAAKEEIARSGGVQREIIMAAIVAPQNLKKAMKQLQLAAEAGQLDLSQHRTTDYRWSWSDRSCLKAMRILSKSKLLTPYGEERLEEVTLHQEPPVKPPPPEPQAVLGPGKIIGKLALIGVPMVLAGSVKARGPVLVAILHRHVLLAALADLPEEELFQKRGLRLEQQLRTLKIQPPVLDNEVPDRPAHLGPVTGPRGQVAKAKVPLAGSFTAFDEAGSPYKGLPAADALQQVLLTSMKNLLLFWDIIHDAPSRLIDALLRSWEPRWLLPGETVIVDEQPDADFIFIVIHGKFIVEVEDSEIDRVGQGIVLGPAQLLGLNEWTRTVKVDKDMKGEAMIQIMRRSSLEESLKGHPGPRSRLKEIKTDLQSAREATWKILERIPAFQGALSPKFLARIFKDADINFYCPHDFVATKGEAATSMFVVLAGKLRSEQAQTLFCMELTRGDWCFQDNILGNSLTRGHDVVAVTHCILMVLYRHCLQNAIRDFRETRQAMLQNEHWRLGLPMLSSLRVFADVPPAVVERLDAEVEPKFFRAGSVILQPGQQLPGNNAYFLLRGELSVSMLGLELRRVRCGEMVGLLAFMGMEVPPAKTEVVAVQTCEFSVVQKRILDEAMKDDEFEDAFAKYRASVSVLAGGPILDAFGFPVTEGGGGGPAEDCVQNSTVFAVCDLWFRQEIPQFVEDVAFFPGDQLYKQGEEGKVVYFIRCGRVQLQVLGRKQHVIVGAGATLGDLAILGLTAGQLETAVAETHVWARALHKCLLQRALSSFPEEEKRLYAEATRRSKKSLL